MKDKGKNEIMKNIKTLLATSMFIAAVAAMPTQSASAMDSLSDKSLSEVNGRPATMDSLSDKSLSEISGQSTYAGACRSGAEFCHAKEGCHAPISDPDGDPPHYVTHVAHNVCPAGPIDPKGKCVRGPGYPGHTGYIYVEARQDYQQGYSCIESAKEGKPKNSCVRKHCWNKA